MKQLKEIRLSPATFLEKYERQQRRTQKVDRWEMRQLQQERDQEAQAKNQALEELAALRSKFEMDLESLREVLIHLFLRRISK